MRGRRADQNVPFGDLDRQLEDHRQQAEDGGHRRQQDRPETDKAGTEGGVLGPVSAGPVFIECVDQHDVVVHHNAGQRDDAKPAHDNAEGLGRRPQAEHDPACRQQDRRHGDEGLPCGVELHHQHDQHQQQRQREGLAQKRAGLGHILVLAGEGDIDILHERRCGERSLKRLDPFGRQPPACHIGVDIHIAVAVLALDIAALLARLEPGKDRKRHVGAVGSRHAQLAETVEVALVAHEPHDDIELVLGIVRTEVRNAHAAGQHLDHGAKAGDRHPVAAGGLTVGDEGPFEARKRPVVGDIDKPAKLVHARHDGIGGGGDLVQIVTHDLDADGKRAARSLLLLGDAEISAGEAGNQPAHAVHQRCRRIALVPVRKDRADGADGITRHLVPAASRPEGARIEILHPVYRKDRCLGGVHQRVTFLGRQIATRQNLHACLLRLDIREEGSAVACHQINAETADNNADHRHHGEHGIADRLLQRPAVASRRGGRNHALWHRLLADDAAKHRNEDQRHEQRCDQHAHHRDGKIFHELADNAGPEQQRQEDHQRRHGRRDNRP